METIHRDYSPKGVQFYYIYKALAHPELRGYVQPFTLEERLMHVREAEEKIGSQIKWLCDGMSNDTKHALGNAPNSEFVLDPEGVVVSRKAWSNPIELRKVLEHEVGPVEEPSRIADLGMKVDLDLPSDNIPSRVIPRLEVPGQMAPLKITPVSDEKNTPFYVKLRAEVTPQVLNGRQGKLYIGFNLDRLYKVHWNNLVKPLKFEITPPDGVEVSPGKGVGPELEEPADRGPREFLLDISGNRKISEPIQLTARYFACDDANTFCIPVTQSYEIALERDRDGGSARRENTGPPEPGRNISARLSQIDRNKDGKVTREELPGPMQRRFQDLDSNGNGTLEESELQNMAERMRGMQRPQGGPRSQANPNQFISRMMSFDSNGDGKLSKEEAPEQMQQRFIQMDSDGDGYVSTKELEDRMRRNRRPQR